jgi:CheY-like chemotaxis protein
MTDESQRPILIVDDEPEVRAVLREYVEGLGRRVVEATNGLEGLWAVKHERPDVVILDLEMPRLNGIDAIRHIQKFDRRIKVIVLSGYLTDALRERLGALGVAAFPKPLALATLGALLGGERPRS